MKNTLLCLSLLGVGASAFALQPADIAVTDLVMGDQCRPVATVKNVGTTSLPVSAYDEYAGAGFNFWEGTPNNGFGGIKFHGADPDKALVPPGGTVQVRSLNAVTGTQTIGIVADPHSTYDDTNLANNTLSKSLTCSEAAGDLAIVSVTFDASCRPVVTLRNAGGGALPDNTWFGNNVFAHRTVDGAPGGQLYLRTADPGKALKPAGGELKIVDTPDTKPVATLHYEIKHAPSGNVADNDVFEVSVPTRCNLATKTVQGSPALLDGGSSSGSPAKVVPGLKAPASTVRKPPQ